MTRMRVMTRKRTRISKMTMRRTAHVPLPGQCVYVFSPHCVWACVCGVAVPAACHRRYADPNQAGGPFVHPVFVCSETFW